MVGGQVPEWLGSFLKNYYLLAGKHYAHANFLNAKPGTVREYSNIAAGLAGYIVELRTGKSLSAYARQFIFNPLRMTSSGWSLAEIYLSRHARLYEKHGAISGGQHEQTLCKSA